MPFVVMFSFSYSIGLLVKTFQGQKFYRFHHVKLQKTGLQMYDFECSNSVSLII